MHHYAHTTMCAERAQAAREEPSVDERATPRAQRHGSENSAQFADGGLAAHVLHLQQTRGTAAVQGLVESASVQRQVDAPPAPTDEQPRSPIADLAQRVGSAAGLRAALSATPSLAQDIVAYFAAGNDDA